MPNGVIATSQSGEYTAETGAVLPTIECLDGHTVVGWLNTTSGLSTSGKVWKSIPAGTTGNLTFEIDETDSLAGEAIFTVTGRTITGFVTGKDQSIVKIPEGVESISSSAFKNKAITSITFPSTLTIIGGSAFENCTSITSITFTPGSTALRIGTSAFYGCYNLTGGVIIPANVTAIGDGAFLSCSRITSVTFAAGSRLTTIGSSAFSGCTGLTGITIPANVTTIDASAFSNCTRLAIVNFAGNNITTLGSSIFSYSGLTSITIPGNVEDLPVSCFSNCTSLRSVTLPNTITRIENSAFSGCSGSIILTIKATTPPTLGSGVFDDHPGTVYVPKSDSVLNAYKSATGWLIWAGRIEKEHNNN